MNLQKLNPWNWFKHEDAALEAHTNVPVGRGKLLDQHGHMNAVPQLFRELDRLWDIVGREPGMRSRQAGNTAQETIFPGFPGFSGHAVFSPELNVSSDEKEYTITVEAAGMEHRDISLELSDRQLLIYGNKSEESEQKEKHFYRIERHYGNFQRVLDLPDDAIVEDISAFMRNGLLSIKVPRKELQAANSRKIQITSG